jgi:hypothetical protein
MKLKLLATAALAGLTLAAATSSAEARPRGGGGWGGHAGGGAWGGHGYVAPIHHGHLAPVHHGGFGGHCAPVYRVRTVEVGRHCHYRTAFLRCGRPFTQRVTVVTYCDHFSNGTTRTWTQSFY